MGVIPHPIGLAQVPLIPPSVGTPLPQPAQVESNTQGRPLAPTPGATAQATPLPTPAVQPQPLAPTVATQVPMLPPATVFQGEGMCPLPESIRKRILNLEYMDMADLRPETWLFEWDHDSNQALQSIFRRCRQPVTDISVWVQVLRITCVSPSGEVPPVHKTFPIILGDNCQWPEGFQSR